MGYTTTGGSGLGLYHIRQVLGDMGGSIELAENDSGGGASFLIKLTAGKKLK
jgi:C4-dicarboxylate-specific signal transduction histidine kinase